VDLDLTFLPIAEELIDNVFGTSIVYKRQKLQKYDPLTGEVIYVLPSASLRMADYQNGTATCVPFIAGDYGSSEAGDGATSLCDDPTLPAGTAEYDDADILPRSELTTKNPFAIYNVSAGVLSRKRIEEGNSAATYEISIWVHHGAAGVPFLPVTGDAIEYDATEWKVTTVEPTYSSKALIASKLTARAA
jgi:hypothetical protein